MRELISVIIPVFNTELYINRCLDSVTMNTYKELEIICINDGSTDKSEHILMEYSKKDSRIVVINQKNKGQSAARNAGLEVATGDYISFIDSDDWVHPQYFEVLLKYIKIYDASIAICKSLQVSKEVNSDNTIREGIAVKFVKGKNAIEDKSVSWGRLWARLFTRESIKKLRIPCICVEDKAFTADVLAQNGDKLTAVIIEESLYFYFMRDDSLVHNFPEAAFIQLCLYDLHRRKKCERNVAYIYTREAVRAFLAYRYINMFRPKSRKKTEKDRSIRNVLIKNMLIDKGIKLIERCYSIVFLLCPQAYRFYRIKTDHTLIDWEKQEKAKYEFS